MSLSIQIKTLLNGTIHAFKEILPDKITVKVPTPFTDSHAQLHYCVLVGMVGDVKARIIIDGEQPLFAKLCQSLYGFELDGDLLESFVGEFGNMVAGKLCIFTANENTHLDITTPTVMIGQTQIPTIQHTFTLPISIADIGEVNLLLTIEN